LEFGPRRESYNWLIDALELYRPVVWEFGRLNLTYTVLSKRKLIRLVNDGIVKGWDDPRMPTIVGVRRRGYTADAINNFCEAIGVTRSDTVMIEYSVLEEHVRDNLNEHAVRAMAVVDPIKVTIANWDKGAIKVERPNIPEKEAGVNNVSFTGTCWIDRADFKETDVKDYFGLALNTSNGKPKWVRLRYATVVRVLEAKKDDTGKIVELIAEYDKENAVKKPSGTIHWVSEPETGKTPVKVELRLYSPLFKSRNPSEVEDWLNDINPDSLKVVHAIADETVKGFKVGDVVQFERVGYFCVDKDSTADNIVLNRTVTLKESKLKPK
jgi:glutaminyl-tRNA synthetase